MSGNICYRRKLYLDMPRPKITFDSDSEDSDNERETATPTFLTTSTVFQQRRPSVLEKLKQANENWSKGKTFNQTDQHLVMF